MEGHNYDDIIDMPHHVSRKHPQMSRYSRAAQFSPFAALSGHSDAIAETARITETKHEVDNDEKEAISSKLQILASLGEDTPAVRFRIFVSDPKKVGGLYESFTAKVKHIDEVNRVVIMTCGRRIPIGNIDSIEGQIFDRFGY